MMHEEEITSFDELLREIKMLDADAGIRIETKYNGANSYIFLTRSGAGYALAIYDTVVKGNLRIPGERVLFKRFSSSEEVERFLSELLNSSYRSFKY